MRYWDSSAVVSLLVDEAGSENRRAVLRQDPGIVTWWGRWSAATPGFRRPPGGKASPSGSDPAVVAAARAYMRRKRWPYAALTRSTSGRSFSVSR